MALPATVYKATIQLTDVDRGMYETLSATVAQHPSETGERLVARLLAFAIFYDEELSFTKGICAADEPDLWIKGGDGRVSFWIEVGLPDAERLIKASRHAQRVALLASGRTFASWEQQAITKLAKVANLTVIAMDQLFISRAASLLERAIVWSLTITEGTCYLTIGDETLETAIRTII
jgi:uncharacterized protein YaeQ